MPVKTNNSLSSPAFGLKSLYRCCEGCGLPAIAAPVPYRISAICAPFVFSKVLRQVGKFQAHAHGHLAGESQRIGANQIGKFPLGADR